MNSVHYVVVFDVFNNKRRRRLVKFLSDFGFRIQYSVFALDVGEKELSRLEGLIKLAIDEKEDSVFIFPMIDLDWSKKKIIGQTTDGMESLEDEALIL